MAQSYQDAYQPSSNSNRPTLLRPGERARRPRGLITPGNIDLYNRPQVPNPEAGAGATSTVYSENAEFPQGEVLYPRVSDATDPGGARILTSQEGQDRYRQTGRNLGVFDNPDDASAYANDLHTAQENGTMDPYPTYSGQHPRASNSSVYQPGGNDNNQSDPYSDMLRESLGQMAAFRPKPLHGVGGFLGKLLPNLGERMQGYPQYAQEGRRADILSKIVQMNRQQQLDSQTRQNQGIENNYKIAETNKLGQPPVDNSITMDEMWRAGWKRTHGGQEPSDTDVTQHQKDLQKPTADNKQHTPLEDPADATKAIEANFDPEKGVYTDAHGNVIANPRPFRAPPSTTSATKDARTPVIGYDSNNRPVMLPAGDAEKAHLSNVMDAPTADVQSAMDARTVRQTLHKTGNKPEQMGVLQLIDSLERDGKLGVAASRLNSFLAGGVGVAPGDDPRILALLDKGKLAMTLSMKSHFGASGGRSPAMLKHFLDMANASKMDAPTLRSGFLAVDDYMGDRAMSPDSLSAGIGTDTVRFIDGGKTYNIPANQVDAFKVDHPNAQPQAR